MGAAAPLCFLVFLALAISSTYAQCVTNTTFPYRLPLSVRPTSYGLFLNLSDPNDGVLTYQVFTS